MMNNDRELIATCSQIIYDGFIRYNNYFHRMTRRARTRFEQRDWKGHQEDINERLDLYEKSVRRVVLLIRKTLGNRVYDENLWHRIREYFGERLGEVPDNDFIKPFLTLPQDGSLIPKASIRSSSLFLSARLKICT